MLFMFAKNKSNAIIEDLTCDTCGNNNLYFDKKNGEFICPNCGLVVFEKIPENDLPKDEKYNNINKKLYPYTSFRLSEAPKKYVPLFKRLIKLNSIGNRHNYLYRKIQNLNIPQVAKENIIQIIKTFIGKRMFSNNDCLIKGAVYIGLRMLGVPYSKKELTEILHELYPQSSINEMFRYGSILINKLLENAEEKGIYNEVKKKLLPKITLNDYIEKYFLEFNLSKKLIDEFKSFNITDNNYPAIVAAGIYFFCENDRGLYYLVARNKFQPTQKNLSEYFGITEPTLRKYLKKIRKCRERDSNPRRH